EAFVTGEKPSTKAAVATLRKATESTKVLVVLAANALTNGMPLRNEPTVHLIEAGQLNTYDVLVADEVVFTTAALAEYVAGPAKGKNGHLKPDLDPHLIPGGVPSVVPPKGE